MFSQAGWIITLDTMLKRVVSGFSSTAFINNKQNQKN
jgi:hypothetical protein